jgi:hypothetical protein
LKGSDNVGERTYGVRKAPRGVLLLDFLRPGVAGSVEDYIPEEVQEYAVFV